MSASPTPAVTPPRRPKRSVRLPPESSSSHALNDPAIVSAFQVSTFEDGYSTEDFISNLSDKLITQSKAESGPFNPVPFMQTFSPALDTLLSLRAQVADRTKKMESDVRRANREYGKRLRELDSGFEAVGGSFANLEGKLTEVGRTSARVGEQLESLHQKRSTAQATSLLLSYYLDLAHRTATTGDGSKSPLEELFSQQNSSEGRVRLATIFRRLMVLAKDVADNAAIALADAEQHAAKEDGNQTNRTVLRRRAEKEKADRVRDEIQKYCEKFEKRVLNLFHRSYAKDTNLPAMAHCAKVLQEFNGGAGCVQVYVNLNPFFISKDQLLEDVAQTDAEIWRTIGNPDTPPPTSEPGLAVLFKQIRSTVSQDVQIMAAVFPNPTAVMQVFLQRVFEQVIHQHIESLWNRASSISTLAALRILHLSHSMCTALVEDLKAYEGTLGRLSRGPKVDSTGPLSATLDQALSEMFMQWIGGPLYLESESKNLTELYAGLLSRFTRYHETVLKAKPNSLLDRVVNSSGQAATVSAMTAGISKYTHLFASSATSAFSSHTGGIAKSPTISRPVSRAGNHAGTPRAMSRADNFRNGGDETPEEDRLFPADGVVTVDMAERMLRWHAEAIGRVVQLSTPGEVPQNVLALSKVLSDAVGRSFIEVGLDSGLARLDQHDTRAEPDLTVLSVLRPADLVCHLWQRYSSTALVPLASSSPVVRRELTTFNQHNVVLMEGKINALIQKAIDSINNWLSTLLMKQKRNDYKPKNDELSFARTNTEPCELCCDFLASVNEIVSVTLSGKNEEAFLTEVGMSFHSLLLEHYKKFPVNPTGGLMLTKDLASYQEAMAAFNLPVLDDRFVMLRQLGNCFIVQPDALRSFMAESHLGRIDPRLLRPYLAQRSDWSQFSRSLAFDDLGDDSPASTPGLPGLSSIHLPAIPGIPGMQNQAAKRAGHRLSAMSGAAGAGMAAGYAKLRDALREFENEGGAKSNGQSNAAGSAPPSSFVSRSNSAANAPVKKEQPPQMPPYTYMSIH